jgi:protein-S-isoprenylcysteine O-methyltransferase Ste14
MHASSTSDSFEDRGGRWVLAQFALMAVCVVVASLPPGWPESLEVPLAALGAVVSLLGAILGVWAWRTLDRAATPFPHPRPGGRLVESGPYEFIRHPIYAGGLLFFGGVALATSPGVFVPLVALALLWRNKADLEEELLVERYPEYRSYRGRVRGAFIPRESVHIG